MLQIQNKNDLYKQVNRTSVTIRYDYNKVGLNMKANPFAL